MLEDDAVEVHQQTDMSSAQAEVRQHLSLVHWCDLLDRLDLQNELVVDNDIHAIAAIQANILVDDRERHLPTIIDIGMPKLETQTFLISRFEQAGTEMAMNLDCQSNHAFA